MTRARYAPALLALLALCVLIGLRRTTDPDLLWHLATAREALAQRSLLPTDIFSYSAAGAPWPYKDLLAAVLLYLAYSAGGFGAFVVLKGLVPLALAGALWLSVPRPRRSIGWVVLVLALQLSAIAFRVQERPLLFSIALFPLQLALLERARQRASQARPFLRALLPVVLLQWLWGLLHREALLGLVLLGALSPYLGAAWLAHRHPSPLSRLFSVPVHGRAPLYAAAAAAAAILLGLVNPYGAAYYLSSLSVYRSQMLKDLILEWRPMPFVDLWDLLPQLVLFVGTALLTQLGMLVLPGRRGAALRRGPDSYLLGALLLCLWLTTQSARYLHFLVGAAALGLAGLMGALVLLLRRPRAHPPRGAVVLLMLVGVVLLASTHPGALGVGPPRLHYAERAMDFARRHGLRPRAANTLPLGGALIFYGWPQLRVEIDGRNDTLYDPAYVVRCHDAELSRARFDEKRAEDGADWVLASTAPPSHAFLARHPGWELVYHSARAAIYVRKGAYPALRPLRFVPRLASGAEVTALLVEARRQPQRGTEDALRAELEQVSADTPEDPRPLAWLAQLYDALGPSYAARRDAAFRRLMQLRD